MIKVQLLVRCEACEGHAYLPECMDVSNNGEPYQRYKPCPDCQGSDKQTKWIASQSNVNRWTAAFSLYELSG